MVRGWRQDGGENDGRDGAMMPIDILMDGDDGKWLTDGRRMMEEW